MSGSTATLTDLVSFNGTNGLEPENSLIADANGDLFGTTQEGGKSNDGTVFEIVNTATGYASSPTVLVSFNGADGSFPRSGLLADANGDLFGTTTNTVFEIVKTATGYASTPTTLVTFNGTDGSQASFAGLIADANGDLFGTTEYGGAAIDGDNGTVFEIAKTATGYASTPTTLVSFNNVDGSQPVAPLLLAANGDLFGTTVEGPFPGDDDGVVFEIAKTATGYASTPTVLVSFNGADGEGLTGGLIADANGDLFGETASGGSTNDGTVFEIVNTATGYASTPTTLVTFNGADGSTPRHSLIMDANGDLFGVTGGGGSDGHGTVFEIVKTATGYASTPTTLVNFNGADGGDPNALLANAAGDLFGTTTIGGTDNDGTVFEITDSGFETPCYCRGTLVRTSSGDVPVEALTVGDRVITLSGEAKPIVWIGMGRVLVTPGRRSAATPIIVRRGALADNVPTRDLRITKGHSLYLDGVLIPAEFLINYRSILWDDQAQVVEFYHIELAAHDVLLAEGASAESYRDDSNRWLFQNANSGWSGPSKPPCAPVLTGGPVVDALWRRLLDRAGPRPAVPLTDEPDLHLLADGQRVQPSRYPGGRYTFRLPRRPSEVRLASRAASPAELGLARDPRWLGVAVRQIRLWQGGRLDLLDAADPGLLEGFHEFEPDEGLRWTDGNALLPPAFLVCMSGPCQLEVLTYGAMHYPLEAGEAELVAA